MNTVKEFQHKGLTIKIVQDTDADSPRNWDNLGTMVCFHRRYQLGDINPKYSQEELQELIERKDVISLPLFLYDHSGLSMKCSAVSCKWDSGQVGYIYVTREKILKEYSKKVLTKKLIAKVIKQLQCEVETYNQYLTGDCYGFQVETETGEHLDSCYGFFGIESCEEQALEQAKYFAESESKSQAMADNFGMATVS